MSNINEQLDILLDNYFKVTKEYIEAVYIFNRDGLLLQKKTPPEEEKSIEEIYGAIAGTEKQVLKPFYYQCSTTRSKPTMFYHTVF